MSSCAVGPCDRYLATVGQLDHVRRRSCRVCWDGDQPQPETLVARRARKIQEAEKREWAKANGLKQPTFPVEIEEEHYGQAELQPRVRTDPTKRPRHRDGPHRVAPHQWVAPR